jgi:hypothetical protein
VKNKMGLTKQYDIWSCLECGEFKGRHDLWFEGDICEECNSFNGAQIRIEAMYLDWLHNFITLQAFADHYEISDFKALRIISIGKRINELKYETNLSSM